MLLPVFVLVGLLTIALAIPMALRKVPPNGLYGLRVRATMADESVWYEANARSGRDLIVVGSLFVVVSVVLSRLGLSETTYSSVCGAVLGIALVVAALRGWLLAEKLLRGRPSGPGSR
jgi:uncharacterized membrane protein